MVAGAKGLPDSAFAPPEYPHTRSFSNGTPVLSSLPGHEVNDIAQAAVRPRRCPEGRVTGSKPVRRSKSTTVQDETGHSPRRIHRLWADYVPSTIAVPWQECANSRHSPGREEWVKVDPYKTFPYRPCSTAVLTQCRSSLYEGQKAPYNPAKRLQNRNRRAKRRIASEGARA